MLAAVRARDARLPRIAGRTPADARCTPVCSGSGCVAVGAVGNSLVETSNGSAWTRQSTPSIPGAHNALDSVSRTPDLTFCEAVGGLTARYS